MAEHNVNKAPDQKNDPKTPNEPPTIFSGDSALERQLTLTLALVNLLLLGSIGALFIKLGWMAVLAVLAL